MLLERENVSVIPVASPIVLKGGSWDALAARLPDLAATSVRRRLGEEARYWSPPASRVAREPHAVAALVFPTYEPGAGMN